MVQLDHPSPMPKVVMGFSATATALALAGAVTALALIFAAGLAALWPLLIGCACAAFLGTVVFLISNALRILARGGLEEKISGVRDDKAEGSVDVQVVWNCVNRLAALDGNTTLERALDFLNANQIITLSTGEIASLCLNVYNILYEKCNTETIFAKPSQDNPEKPAVDLKSLSMHLTLNSLGLFFKTKGNGDYPHSSPDRALPALLAILSFVRGCGIAVVRSSGGLRLVDVSRPEAWNEFSPSQVLCAIYNYDRDIENGNQYEHFMGKKLGKQNIFLAHYESGRLVIG
ncbi:MAG: hypothetical protein LBT98_00685 [Puniceicoccales bacterium]|jgi:hypothetical protein|nr:hypothetical protein [Puniceicoccales bacterium]